MERARYWGVLDIVLDVPFYLFSLAFWIWLLSDGRFARLNQFFAGSRNAAETTIGALLFLTFCFALLSATLFLKGRRLFGILSRGWTIAAAIVFLLFAVATAYAGLAAISGVFM